MFVSTIIAAGGTGSRLGKSGGKQLLDLGGRPIVLRSLEKMLPFSDEVIIVIAEGDVPRLKEALERHGLEKKVKEIVPGGATRARSVHAAFKKVSQRADIVCIHDGVRPFVEPADVRKVIAEAEKHGAAVLCTRVKDTIKQENAGFVAATPQRAVLWSAQTPQVIKKSLLDEAYRTLKDWDEVTDDVALVEMLGKPVKIIQGSYRNMKITTHEDLIMAEAFLKG